MVIVAVGGEESSEIVRYSRVRIRWVMVGGDRRVVGGCLSSVVTKVR